MAFSMLAFTSRAEKSSTLALSQGSQRDLLDKTHHAYMLFYIPYVCHEGRTQLELVFQTVQGDSQHAFLPHLFLGAAICGCIFARQCVTSSQVGSVWLSLIGAM